MHCNAHDSEACRLHLVGYDRHFRADQSIYQCRFTGVGRTDDRDKSETCLFGISQAAPPGPT